MPRSPVNLLGPSSAAGIIDAVNSKPGHPQITGAHGLGALGLDLIEHASNGGEHFQPGRTGLDHLSLPAKSLPDLQDWASWLDACGVSHSGIRDAAGVGAMLNFADPEGIALEFLFLDLEKLSHSAFAPG